MAYARKRAGAIAAGAAVEPEPANRPHDGRQVRLVRRAAFEVKLPCHAAIHVTAQSAACGMQCHLLHAACNTICGCRLLVASCCSDMRQQGSLHLVACRT